MVTRIATFAPPAFLICVWCAPAWLYGAIASALGYAIGICLLALVISFAFSFDEP